MKAETTYEPVRSSPYTRPSQPPSLPQGFSSQLLSSPQLHEADEQERPPPNSSALAAQSSSRAPTAPYRFDFGKHKGKTIDQGDILSVSCMGSSHGSWLAGNGRRKKNCFYDESRSTSNFTAQDRVSKGSPERKLPTYQKSVSRGRYSGRKRW